MKFAVKQHVEKTITLAAGKRGSKRVQFDPESVRGLSEVDAQAAGISVDFFDQQPTPKLRKTSSSRTSPVNVTEVEVPTVTSARDENVSRQKVLVWGKIKEDRLALDGGK